MWRKFWVHNYEIAGGKDFWIKKLFNCWKRYLGNNLNAVIFLKLHQFTNLLVILKIQRLTYHL